MRKRRTAILISGRGTNMMSLIEAAKEVDYPADIRLVISNRPEADGLRRADEAVLSAIAIDHTDFSSRKAFERELDAALTSHDIEFVACAGFMRILTPWFVNRWSGRMINIHPSLLPKYKGLNTHQRAIEAGDQDAGATVHWVCADVDAGDIIDQIVVPIPAGATVETLTAAVLNAEHILYPRALKKAVLASL